jgi:CRP/FNR family transcriptional regulator
MTDLEWIQFTTRFPTLTTLDQTRDIVRNRAIVKRVPAKEVLYRDGDACDYLPMVVTGELSLSKHAETGRSIVLYRVGSGESCILSTLSILTRRAFPAEAVTEVPATVVLIPASVVRDLIDTDPAWRAFAFSVYQDRLAGLITLVEEIVFARLDVRLAEHLIARQAKAGGPIVRTHQEIAAELGSSREVVSRLLKEWERRGIVELTRGRITITDGHFLSQTAGEP